MLASASTAEVPIAFVRTDQVKLEVAAVSATVWTLVAYGLSQCLRMGNNVLLAHLLAPQSFGLMALASTLVLGMILLSDIGLVPSVVNSPRGDEPLFLNTAWSIQILRGFLLWLCCCALALPLSLLYEDSRIRVLLPVLGLQLVIASFNNIHMIRVARHMSVKRLLMLELGAQSCAIVVTVSVAWRFPSIWALVAGTLAGALAKALASHFPGVLPGHRNALAWDREAVSSLIHFGKWILFATAFYFFASQADRLILGGLISFAMLGVYNIAFTIADIPRQVIQQFANRVGFPFVVKLTKLPFDEFRRELLRYRRMVLGAGSVLLALVVLAGGPLATHLYDARYHDAAWIVPLLGLGLWHTLMYTTTSSILLALKKPQYNTIGTAAYCASMFLCLPLAFHFYGLRGAVVSVAVGDLPIYIVLSYGAVKQKVNILIQDGISTLGFAAHSWWASAFADTSSTCNSKHPQVSSDDLSQRSHHD